jgi:hypothetical protein
MRRMRAHRLTQVWGATGQYKQAFLIWRTDTLDLCFCFLFIFSILRLRFYPSHIICDIHIPAVLDDNAYDRKIGLCNGKAKGNGKILGWSEDQVQVIVDDDNENDDSDDGEGGQNSRDDIGRASDSSTTSSISAAIAEKKVSKIIPKGILKSAAAAQAAKPLRPTQEVSNSGGSGKAPGKPCFEYSQTGKCRRGGIRMCVCVSV